MTSSDPHGDWQAKPKATMAPANAFVGRRLMGLDAFDAGSDQRQAPNHHWHTDRAVPGAHPEPIGPQSALLAGRLQQPGKGFVITDRCLFDHPG